MKIIFLGISLLAIQLIFMSPAAHAEPAGTAFLLDRVFLSNEQLELIGDKIFYNECGGRFEDIIQWNNGENFLSLGIGHFIWYAKGNEGAFDESFPKLLIFMRAKGRKLPAWLAGAERPYCPWGDREVFMRDLSNEKMLELRAFLIETKSLQLLFLAERLQQALPKMLGIVSEEAGIHVKQQFFRVTRSPYGLYALIDYVNFKGEGVLLSERYNGRGWGLLQVLEEMQGNEIGIPAIQEFARAAEQLLIARVNNAPSGVSDSKWLPVWQRRVKTYYDFAIKYKDRF